MLNSGWPSGTLLYALLGLVLGVMVNRAADNLPPPARVSLWAAPRCPFCGRPRGFDQLALFSALLFRARCAGCLAPLRLRAPLVELGTMFAFWLLWTRYGPSPQLLFVSLVWLILLLILVIDLEHRLILNAVVLPATAGAMAISPWNWVELEPWRALIVSAAGALAGGLVVLGIYALAGVTARVLAQRRGQTLNVVPFGMGDVKLATFVGALTGLGHVFPTLLYTILLGGVGAVALILYHLLVYRRYNPFLVMPYGPYFVLATWYVLWTR